jgi:hypothetical protein
MGGPLLALRREAARQRHEDGGKLVVTAMVAGEAARAAAEMRASCLPGQAGWDSISAWHDDRQRPIERL